MSIFHGEGDEAPPGRRPNEAEVSHIPGREGDLLDEPSVTVDVPPPKGTAVPRGEERRVVRSEVD